MPFLVFILANIASIFIYDDVIFENLCNFIIFNVAWCGYYTANKPVLFNKSIMLTLCLYNFYIFSTDIIFNYIPEWFCYLEIALFAYLLSYQLHKNYNYKSDKITTNTICLTFYKPKRGIKHILISLLGFPVSSFGVICGRNWLRYTNKSNFMQLFNIKDLTDNYIIIDTGIKITPQIRSAFYEAMKVKASFLGIRLNCVRGHKKLLNLLGSKWKYRSFDFMPSIYFARRL